MLRVTKGNPFWNHTVTLEGSIIKSPLDVVYWLNLHLTQNHGTSLSDISRWTDSVKDRPLWNMSTDVMRERFKVRVISAGFPAKMFSFHSLRSGFLCSALLKAGSDKNALSAVLENTAFVAGWIPNRPAQLRYVKESVKRTIVATRLITNNETSGDASVIDKILSTSENFHNITLAGGNWDPETNYRQFFKVLNAKFSLQSLPKRECEYLRMKCWRKSMNQYVLASHMLEDEANEIFSLDPSWSSNRVTIESNARMLVGRRCIAKLLNEDFSRLDGLVSLMYSLAADELILTLPLNLKKLKDRTVPKLEEREHFVNTGHRKRVRWSAEEDGVLVRGVSERKGWVEICSFLPLRTNIDCKDRWRTLKKAQDSKPGVQ